MRKGDLKLQLGGVDFNRLRVNGVRIGSVKCVRPFGARFDVFPGDFVRRKDAVFRAGFDGHVGHGQPVGHGKPADGFARELHRGIESAVHADASDDVKNQVFSGNPFLQFAVDDKFDRRRNLEPQFAREHGGGEIRAADAGGKSAQGAVGAGVAVRADDQVAGKNDALFRQQRVFDAHLSAFVEIRYAELEGELADGFALLGGVDVFVRRKMIQNQRHPVAVKNLLPAGRAEFADGDGRRDVVAQRDIDPGVDEPAGRDFLQVRVGH